MSSIHAVEHSGLEIRVVLWPQSTKTSVGPPYSATVAVGGGPVVYWKTHHKIIVQYFF